jgi:hypothetical protein
MYNPLLTISVAVEHKITPFTTSKHENKPQNTNKQGYRAE